MSIWSMVALEMPASRILPSSSSSFTAPMDSAYGSFGSGRWNWYSPMASTPSAFSDASMASSFVRAMHSGPFGRKMNLSPG